jgi:hypothetical protein
MELYGIAAVCGFSGVLVAWCLPRSLYPRDQQVTIASRGAKADAFVPLSQKV